MLWGDASLVSIFGTSIKTIPSLFKSSYNFLNIASISFINYPVLFLVKTSGSRWVALTDLSGRDGTGRASGKIPIEMVVPVLNPEDAKTFIGQFGGRPPSTEEMLGSLADAFHADREGDAAATPGQV